MTFMAGVATRLNRALRSVCLSPIGLRVRRPAELGQFIPAVDLVHALVTWFSAAGAVPAHVAMRIVKQP